MNQKFDYSQPMLIYFCTCPVNFSTIRQFKASNAPFLWASLNFRKIKIAHFWISWNYDWFWESWENWKHILNSKWDWMLSMNQKMLPRFFRLNYVSMANDHGCNFKSLDAPKVVFFYKKSWKFSDFRNWKLAHSKDY